jgi:anti-sigma factor RsiW
MKPCPHEAELQAIVRSGHWPDACEPELRKHVETCGRCAEQVLVLHAFQTARAQTVHAARADHPNLLWWRAQLRRRNEALQRVSRPITTAQIFALCISIVTAAALLISQLRKGFSWSSWLPDPSSAPNFDALSFFTSLKTDWGLLLLLTGVGTVVLLSAVVLYLASDRS